jgi:hypothetical protein
MALRNEYLNSFSAKLVASEQAARRFRKWRSISADEVKNTAARLDVWSFCREPVRVRNEPKSNGRTRQIDSFSLMNSAQQHLVANVMRAFLPSRLHPAQYGVAGAGLLAARTAVLNALNNRPENRRLKWAVRFDVRDFYPSINIRG